jgi:alcohol dehydrogenase (cytochrome c)
MQGKSAVRIGAIAMLAATTIAAQGLFAAGPTGSAEQIERGGAAYTRLCMSCHGAALEGTQFAGPLKGPVFVEHWRGRTREEFSTKVRTTMPPRGIGTLSSSQLADIEAFVLGGGTAVAAQVGGAPPAVGGPPGPPPGQSSPPPEELQRMAEMRRRQENDPLLLAATAARRTKLAALAPVTDALLRDPPAGDWLVWRRAYDGLGYSPLKDINRSNVARLRVAWSWSLPLGGAEMTPLVHDGVIFVYSGPAVQALDAASGELLWQYLRTLPDEANNGRDARAKTLAIYGDLLYAATADGHVVALDVRSGRVAWDQTVVPKPQGAPSGVPVQLSSGPIVARGKVILGVSLGTEYRGGDFIIGLDADTGREAWRFHTIARPGQPGGDSWNGAPVEERFGGGTWVPGSYDPQLNLVYFGTGNTYSAGTLLLPRPGAQGLSRNDALYTDSTVALRPETGELVWHYQHHRRDVWDLDWAFEQSILTLPVDGKPRKLVVTAGKAAVFDAMDAATGAWVFSKDMGLQNIFTGIDPKTGEKHINPAVEPDTKQPRPRELLPGSVGARNWSSAASNPDAHLLFTTLREACSMYVFIPRPAPLIAQGGTDIVYPPCIPPEHDGKFGRLAAVDLATREIRWTHRQRVPFVSALLATAGGVLFGGDLDRWFHAFDQKNGKVLWRTRLSAAPESFPITYEAEGRQFVAVVAGGGTPWGSGGRGMVPEITAPAAGVTLVVFELPP